MRQLHHHELGHIIPANDNQPVSNLFDRDTIAAIVMMLAACGLTAWLNLWPPWH